MNVSRRTCLQTGPVLLAAALAACSSPATRYYRLIAVPGAVQNAAPMTVAVRYVSIPGYLNRDEIAKVCSDYRFEFYSNDLWSDRLSSMLQAVMVQDLVQRLPAVTVLGSGGSINTSSDILIQINVLRFEPNSRGDIILSAQIAINSGVARTPWPAQTFDSSSALSNSGSSSIGPDASQIVAKMSELWAAMANRAADIIIEYQDTRSFARSGSG